MSDAANWQNVIAWDWIRKLTVLSALLLLMFACGYFGVLRAKLSELQALVGKTSNLSAQLNSSENNLSQPLGNKFNYQFFSGVNQALAVIHQEAAASQIQLVSVKPETRTVVLQLNAGYFPMLQFLQRLFDSHYGWFVKYLLLTKKSGQLHAELAVTLKVR